MRQFFYLIIALSFLLSFSGCSTVGKALNPYEDDFSCPKTSGGKCVSVSTAYNESTEQSNNTNAEFKKLIVETKEKSPLNTYENMMFNRMASLLKEPVTPIVAPPPVVRVLFLSYKGDSNELFMPRFIYFFADDPKWIMGDYISGKETE